MGLKHPHEARGSFPTMPADRDSIEYSVMSYKSYVGSTKGYYTNEQWSYPQSLMMYDIAALQNLYGANYTTNVGNTIYGWNAQTGEMYINGAGQGAPGGNRVFLTIWDGGGNDTYDFSNYASDLNVSLQPGSWSTISQTQLANLGDGHYAAGNIANALLYKNNPASLIENVIGGSGNDKIVGNSGNNSFTGGAGNDTIDGLGGVNTAIFSGNAADYSLTQNADGSWTVTDLRAGSPDGIDQLKNIQYFNFQDATVATNSNVAVVNNPPDAINDSYSTARNKKLVVGPASGVLANDTDADGNQLTTTLGSGPRNGKVSLNADGSFTYTPNSRFTGTDSFTYKVSDGTGSDTATVTIKVGSSSTTSWGWGRGMGANTVLSDHHDTVPSPTNDSFTWSENSLYEKIQGLLDSFEQSFQRQSSDLGADWHGLPDQKFKIDLHDVFDHMLVR
jgi:VCBS repeat-containing protein